MSLSFKIALKMKFWCTHIQAIDPIDGELKTFGGPDVPGLAPGHAQQYCNENGLGYCKVIGELVSITSDKGAIEYSISELN